MPKILLLGIATFAVGFYSFSFSFWFRNHVGYSNETGITLAGVYLERTALNRILYVVYYPMLLYKNLPITWTDKNVFEVDH